MANPLVGSIVDAVVAAGGRAVFGETIEWLGAEHLLAARAADAAVAHAIRAAVLRRERMPPAQQPLAGGLFAAKTGVRGIALRDCAIALPG